MKKEKIAVILVLFAVLILPLTGCLQSDDEADPVKEYDKMKVVLSDESGDVIFRWKKYDYEDTNFELFRVENGTDTAYDVLIVGTFHKTDGTTFKFLKRFSGFPANRSGYLSIFPEQTYVNVSFRIKLTPHVGDTPLEFVHAKTDMLFTASAYPADIYFTRQSPAILAHHLSFRFVSESERLINYSAKIAVLDNRGEVFKVFDSGGILFQGSDWKTKVIMYPEVDWADDYVLPDNLTGDLYAVTAFEQVSWDDGIYVYGEYHYPNE